MKQVLAWGAWTVLLWFATVSVGGLLVGGLARDRAEDPAMAEEVGAQARADFGSRRTGVILVVSMVIAGAGTIGQVLPGTKSSQTRR